MFDDRSKDVTWIFNDRFWITTTFATNCRVKTDEDGTYHCHVDSGEGIPAHDWYKERLKTLLQNNEIIGMSKKEIAEVVDTVMDTARIPLGEKEDKTIKELCHLAINEYIFGCTASEYFLDAIEWLSYYWWYRGCVNMTEVRAYEDGEGNIDVYAIERIEHVLIGDPNEERIRSNYRMEFEAKQEETERRKAKIDSLKEPFTLKVTV